jgi:hypothetical protein
MPDKPGKMFIRFLTSLKFGEKKRKVRLKKFPDPFPKSLLDGKIGHIPPFPQGEGLNSPIFSEIYLNNLSLFCFLCFPA